MISSSEEESGYSAFAYLGCSCSSSSVGLPVNDSRGSNVGTAHLTFTLPSAVASFVYGSPGPDMLMTIGGAVSRLTIRPYPSICPSRRPSSSSLTRYLLSSSCLTLFIVLLPCSSTVTAPAVVLWIVRDKLQNHELTSVSNAHQVQAIRVVSPRIRIQVGVRASAFGGQY